MGKYPINKKLTPIKLSMLTLSVKIGKTSANIRAYCNCESIVRIGPILLGSLSLGFAWTISGCDNAQDARAADSLANKPLAEFQVRLLDTSLEAVSLMPDFPHIKNRCRAQARVAQACIALDQPLRAASIAEGIDDWRQGTAYGELALYCAEKGFPEDSVKYAAMAREQIQAAEDWRKDRIRVLIARVYMRLKRAQDVEQHMGNLGAEASASLAITCAEMCTEAEFEQVSAQLDDMLAAKAFEGVKNALAALAVLYDRFYDNTARRDQCERQIKAAWGQMPVGNRLEVLMSLTGHSLTHDDQTKALSLVNEAEALMASATWQPRFKIPLGARLAGLRARAGEPEDAKVDLKGLEALFDENEEKIINTYQAGLLRAIAGAWHVMGDSKTALEVYRRAIEAGVKNPNSRPRADDLAQTCCAMAQDAVAPDEALWTRIQAIQKALGGPW